MLIKKRQYEIQNTCSKLFWQTQSWFNTAGWPDSVKCASGGYSCAGRNGATKSMGAGASAEFFQSAAVFVYV